MSKRYRMPPDPGLSDDNRRNFDEALRVIDSRQLTANHTVSTPANWQPDEDMITAGSVSDEEARNTLGDWQAPRPYITIVPWQRESEPVAY